MYISLSSNADDFVNEIKIFSSVNAYDCYQCGKCSAGCTVGADIEDSPTKLLRLIQLNQRDKTLDSKTPFICATCNTCSERCPMGIDVAKVMETLRILAISEKRKPARSVAAFSQLFLYSVKTTGRLFELGMTAGYNVVTGKFLKDAGLGAALFKNGKIAIVPKFSKNNKDIQKIFKRSKPLSDAHGSKVKEGH